MATRRDPIEASIRRPPGFMEYGADLLALERVKLMSLAERGLLATMRWYVWTNDTLPADPKLMARLLGLESGEVAAALTDRVRSFFSPVKGDPTRLFCPELSAQMKRLIERREKMLQGTINSHIARKEQEKQGKEEIGTHDGTHSGTHGGSGLATELNCTEPNRTALRSPTEPTKTPSFKGKDRKDNAGAIDPEFVSGYEAEQRKEAAGRA